MYKWIKQTLFTNNVFNNAQYLWQFKIYTNQYNPFVLLGGEKQWWLSVLLKDTSTTVAARNRTHIILTTRPSGHGTPLPKVKMKIIQPNMGSFI